MSLQEQCYWISNITQCNLVSFKIYHVSSYLLVFHCCSLFDLLSPWRCSRTHSRSALKSPSLYTRRWETSACRCSSLWRPVFCPVAMQRHRRCPHDPSAWDRGKPHLWTACWAPGHSCPRVSLWMLWAMRDLLTLCPSQVDTGHTARAARNRNYCYRNCPPCSARNTRLKTSPELQIDVRFCCCFVFKSPRKNAVLNVCFFKGRVNTKAKFWRHFHSRFFCWIQSKEILETSCYWFLNMGVNGYLFPAFLENEIF